MRRASSALAIAAATLAVSSPPADANWNQTGSGAGYSLANTMPAGRTPTASVNVRAVTVSWAASSGAVPIDGYIVKRYSTAGVEQAVGASCSGTISGLTCTEQGVPPGDWRYSVTPVRGSWRGTESSQSSAVTVASPNFTLNSSSAGCLPETETGQITNFKQGQTVSFRLDDPTTGQVLSGSINPSPVPASGTASVSVTIPAGVADAPHTVYAIGNQGDVVGVPLGVDTSGIRVSSGTYTGNATDNRNITGAGFQPDLVIIKGNTTQVAVARTPTMIGDASKPLSGATALQPDRIQALQSNGFQVGVNPSVNASGTSYTWTAIKGLPGHMTLGSYNGNGQASQAVTGLGFSPEYVIVASANAAAAVQRMAGMTTTFQFDTNAGVANGINSLDSNGFTVGNSATTNSNGVPYGYLAFNQCAGEMNTSSYAGNAAASRSITGIGFQPNYLLVRANDTATARQGVSRPSALTGSSSLLFGATANIANGITAIGTDGFSVGNNAATNANGVVYRYVALRDSP
jgi:hypothetical protein